MSQTPIFVLLPVWEYEEENRETTTNDEKEESQFRKCPNICKMRVADFEGCSMIGSHVDDPASQIGTKKNTKLLFSCSAE